MNDAQPESSDGDDIMKEGGEQQEDGDNLNIPLTGENFQSEMLEFPQITSIPSIPSIPSITDNVPKLEA